ncbi:MAG: ligase-associated DNA damage response endonuclease PdeM [Rhodobacter sp.]|nr:ligase-associated DNA damage response endonuclease PdeM [Rhodobacter sp.]MCA3514500.1 ligase-associated DNA damage response endonuclease PdeM [Rhodobacter sp.]MCA3520997.1 ligase-associated DNA damage response endonuclease PdeM [Rhodobacter sp.]MCA3523893.1 ligase-associated DNA damage response endonuclease PdeM [Rhodobacter sp.]MCA3526301.1 ligase-associated DNA damage response endonuclease PdeM [Rhodobacter sp.]
MTAHAFTLAGQPLLALASGALYWPAQDLLCVSDLHLGKSERLARRGGTLLPPYETRETLTRLDGVLAATGARHVVCLGDSFDDGAAGGGLEEDDRLRLCALMAGRRWTWIAGNHDPAPLVPGGTHLSEFATAGLTFRHIALPGKTGEVSGHFHPKARVAGRSRPCFLIDRARVILPAFGCYTGGLRATDPALAALMGPQALAVLTGPRALAIPMPR